MVVTPTVRLESAIRGVSPHRHHRNSRDVGLWFDNLSFPAKALLILAASAGMGLTSVWVAVGWRKYRSIGAESEALTQKLQRNEVSADVRYTTNSVHDGGTHYLVDNFGRDWFRRGLVLGTALCTDRPSDVYEVHFCSTQHDSFSWLAADN
jgi:hypothetical protein